MLAVVREIFACASVLLPELGGTSHSTSARTGRRRLGCGCGVGRQSSRMWRNLRVERVARQGQWGEQPAGAADGAWTGHADDGRAGRRAPRLVATCQRAKVRPFRQYVGCAVGGGRPGAHGGAGRCLAGGRADDSGTLSTRPAARRAWSPTPQIDTCGHRHVGAPYTCGCTLSGRCMACCRHNERQLATRRFTFRGARRACVNRLRKR